MIEFSRIKKITINEGVVKKITNSSGVVLWKAANDTSGDTSSVTVDLNNQWVESTNKLDGYVVFMSNSNKGVANGYASMKFKFKGEPDFKIWIYSFAEYSQDYTIAFNLDVDYPTTLPSSDSKGVKDHTKYSFSFGDATSIDDFTEVDYPNDGGEHFVVVTYRKNESIDEYDYRGYVAIKAKLLSTSWVVSSTEFLKENDKYYQRINEIGTYEGGITATTGNFKKGNELTPTYIQSSDASDYMLVGSKMYYKKYAWVTPVDTEINTGDYIQGDYIGEAPPSMKVTYTDDTEKTFYDLTSIKSDTIPDDDRSKVKNIEIYDTVTSIGDSAFYDFANLENITLSDSIKTFGMSAFNNCVKLKSLTLPISLIDIGAYSFQDCSSLTSIDIPSSITHIGDSCFRRCSNLSSVTIRNSDNKVTFNTSYSYPFVSISSTAKLYVPSNLLADYKADGKLTSTFQGGIYAIGS